MATFTSNYAWTKPAGSDPVDISVLNDNLDSQDGIMHDAFLNMADPFSESSTYAVGAIVLYGTKTYKCHTAVTTAGSWTGAANWDEHKISALVLDNAPTDGSNNPVKSDGIYDSEKDIYAVMGQMGAKNFNIFPYKNGGAGDVWSTNGIDFTVNADGTIDVNGTATADAFFRCGISTDDSNPIFLVAGTTYILSGSGSSNIDVRLRNSSNAGVANAGIEDAEYECTTSGKYYILVIAKNGKTISHYTVKPMIRLASDTDDTYQPYAKTNKQLTDAVSSILTEQDSIETELDTKADKTATASGETLALVPTSEGRALLHTAYGMSVQNGTPTPSSPVDIVSAKADFRSVGKNLLTPEYSETKIVENGVTYTFNSDGSVVFNTDSSGATANTNCNLKNNTIEVYPAGSYHISGCPSGGGVDAKFRMWLRAYKPGDSSTPLSNNMYDEGEGLTFTINEPFVLAINVSVLAGKVCNNMLWKPMLTYAGVSDSDYAHFEPYKHTDITTDLTLRAIEVTSSDAYNLVRDNKYYIADTLDYTEDDGFVVTRRIGHIASYDSETLTTKWMSSKDVYASGTYPSAEAVVDYILTSENTEAITTAQALALLGLKTYDESTTISSQAEPSCTVAVEYAKERLGALALTAYNTAKGNDLRITALES